MTLIDYLMPAAVILVSVLGWIFFLRGRMVEKRELDIVKNDLVREIGALRDGTMADIAELRANVREIRHDVKTLLSR